MAHFWRASYTSLSGHSTFGNGKFHSELAATSFPFSNKYKMFNENVNSDEKQITYILTQNGTLSIRFLVVAVCSA